MNAVNGMRERRNHSIAGYASGLALGSVPGSTSKGEQGSITSPINIVASNSIKNNRLLFKNENVNDPNYLSPTQVGPVPGPHQGQHNSKMNPSRGKMQQRYSNYLTQQMIMANSQEVNHASGPARASTDITMYASSNT
jgi:hypothetical protein